MGLKFVVVVTSSIILLGCSPMSYEKFLSSDLRQEPPLPQLHSTVNLKLLEASYYKSLYTDAIRTGDWILYKHRALNESFKGLDGEPEALVFSNRSKDMQHLIDDELKRSFFSKDSMPGGGRFVMDVTYLGTSWNPIWFWAPGLTLWTVCLFGVPAGSQTAYLRMECSIFDSTGNRLWLCEVPVCEGTAYAAAYWGYSWWGAGNLDDRMSLTRAAFCKAIAVGLAEIRNQLWRDAKKFSMAFH
jgi:hypothetical protein